MKLITIIIIAAIILIIIGCVVVYYLKNKSVNEKYQGPVPEGYDEKHFRETGETKLIKNQEEGI